MNTKLVKCNHCRRDKYPRELHPDGRGGMICTDCVKKTHGERQGMKRELARETVWNGGRGWVC